MSEIQSDIFGDIRLIRHAILHGKGILAENAHKRLKLLQEYFQPDSIVALPNTTMHRVFYLVKKDTAQRILTDSGLASADTEDVISVALQNIGRCEGD